MSDTQPAQGRCLCGKVHITANRLNPHIYACHCGMCRKWIGGPLLSVECGTDVMFDGAENISTYASSDWAERGFCKVCGTTMFYRVKESGEYFMSAGLFDEVKFELTEQIFIDRKPDYYSFANQTKNMTEAEVFAMFASAADQ